MPVERLDAAQKSALSTTLPNWVVNGDKLHRDLEFNSFVEAFGFMAQVALLPCWPNPKITIRTGATFTTACRST